MEALVFGGLSPALAPILFIMLPVTCVMFACTCAWCRTVRIRNVPCIKRCLRCVGTDGFDSFEVTIFVHEVLFDQRKEKNNTFVRVTAGEQSIDTSSNSQGIFQEPLSIFVEQGCDQVTVDLIDATRFSSQKVLAQLVLDPVTDIIQASKTGKLEAEMLWPMKAKQRVTHPKAKLTIIYDAAGDMETGLLQGTTMSPETAWQVRQQLSKTASRPPAGVAGPTDLEVLAQASQGPLDMFQGLGNADTIYVGITGPPEQRKWMLGIYQHQADFQNKARPMLEIELLRVRSVQVDPSRSNVFAIHHTNANKVIQQVQFRRIDRSRDVWVEMLQLLIKEVHSEANVAKMSKAKAAGVQPRR